MSYFPRIIITLMLVGGSLTGCSEDRRAFIAHQQQIAKMQMDSLDRVAAQTAKMYKAMDNSALLRKLVQQSKLKKEPFNSLAFRELQSRKDVNADSLSAIVRGIGNEDALLPLLLLRRLHAKAYAELPVELRVKILTSALEQSKTFNTWGVPQFYVEDAGQALIECGKSAEPALRRMLTETRPAPVFGSKEYMAYLRYQYRLCDYALFFIEQIEGHKDFIMPIKPADRDSIIRKL